MSEEKRIIMPGDLGWDQPRADEVAPPKKLPDALLEAAFSEVVNDAISGQDMVSEGSPVVPDEVVPVPVVSPMPVEVPRREQSKISYKYHKPASIKAGEMKMPKPIQAELLEDLSRAWERKCFTSFKKGTIITITGFTWFEGVGNLLMFAEGARGSYCIRPDQVKMLLPNPEVKSNDAMDGQGIEIREARPASERQPEG